MHLFTCLETTSTVNAEWNAVCPSFWRAINELFSYKQVPALCYPYSCYSTWILTSLVFSTQMTSNRQQLLVSISSCTASSIHVSLQDEKTWKFFQKHLRPWTINLMAFSECVSKLHWQSLWQLLLSKFQGKRTQFTARAAWLLLLTSLMKSAPYTSQIWGYSFYQIALRVLIPFQTWCRT